MRTEREIKGEETEKTEKEERNCHVNLPPIGGYSGTKLHASGSILGPNCMLPERAGEGESTLPSACRGNQAQKPASYMSPAGRSPTHTPVYR